MTWGKMDDKFHRNRKVRELRRMKGGREALGDWAFWWSWCLDDAELTGVIPLMELDAADIRSAKLLVKVGLWDEIEDGFRFHDFHEYNPTKSQREHKKTTDRERAYAKRHGIPDDVASDSQATPERVADDSQASRERVASTRVPNPTQPNPTESDARAPVAFGWSDITETFSRLRSEAWQRKTGNPGGRWKPGTKDHGGVASALELFREEPDPQAALEDSIAGFLADPWCIERSWPFSAWANDPGKYRGVARSGPGAAPEPVTPPNHAADEVRRLRDAAKARELAGDWDSRDALRRQADDLARSLQGAA